MPTDHVRPPGERTWSRRRHSDDIGFLAESKNIWLGKKCHGNSDFCQISSKTTEGCASALTSPIRWCSVNCLHKRVRLNWITTHCICITLVNVYVALPVFTSVAGRSYAYFMEQNGGAHDVNR